MARPPNQQTVEVALGELRNDAAKWRDAADELRSAAAGLGLGQFEFSAPATWMGVTEVYQELHHKLTRLLNEGADTLHDIGKALATAADAYEEEDRASAHRIHGIW